MGSVWIGGPRRPPGVAERAGDRQGALDLVVIAPHLAPVDRPVGAVTKLGARLEMLGPEAQRHHGEMYGRAADRLAAVVAAHLDRVGPVDDALVQPIELGLRLLVGREVLQRPEEWAGVEGHDGKALLGQPRRQGSAAGACADDGEIHRLVVAMAAHGGPAVGAEHVRRPAVRGPRSRLSDRHGRFPRPPWPRDPGGPATPPRDRAC